MLEFNAVHDINDEKITITTNSGAVVSAMPKNMLLNVPQSETCENKLNRVAMGSNSKDLGGEITMFKTNGSTQLVNFMVADVTEALASVSKICRRKNKLVFGEDEASSTTMLLERYCPREWRAESA